jgi:hypothetical protein
MGGLPPRIDRSMSNEPEMQQLKDRIAQVYAQRERLKQALALGELAPRAGFLQLDRIDLELSGLDSRYKQLWDAAQTQGEEPT